MKALPIVGLGLAAAMTTAALAQPLTMPGRRAGLWEMSMSGTAMGGQSMTMRQCVDPASERSFSPFNGGPGGRGETDASNCSKRDVHRIPGGWAFESICTTRNGRTLTSSGTIIGDFQSHYHMDISTSGGGGEARHMAMDNKWVGACPADGGQGNTITLPDGRVITIPQRH